MEAADRDGAGDVTGGGVTRGVAKIVLEAGGGCWRTSSVVMGGDDMAMGGSYGEAVVVAMVVMGGWLEMVGWPWWGEITGDEQAEDSDRYLGCYLP